jgi:hypothetical protein
VFVPGRQIPDEKRQFLAQQTKVPPNRAAQLLIIMIILYAYFADQRLRDAASFRVRSVIRATEKGDA